MIVHIDDMERADGTLTIVFRVKDTPSQYVVKMDVSTLQPLTQAQRRQAIVAAMRAAFPSSPQQFPVGLNLGDEIDIGP